MNTKTEKIRARINNNKELLKNIQDLEYHSADAFIVRANAYIKAIKENRVICSIGSVSPSGMSRTIKFLECAKSKGTKPTHYNFLTFWAMFKILGFKEAKNNRDYFRINGCGMDMIFHTNYTIMHNLKALGFISKKQCDVLAQNTPGVI
jgi:hypothetical protein